MRRADWRPTDSVSPRRVMPTGDQDRPLGGRGAERLPGQTLAPGAEARAICPQDRQAASQAQRAGKLGRGGFGGPVKTGATGAPDEFQRRPRGEDELQIAAVAHL